MRCTDKVGGAHTVQRDVVCWHCTHCFVLVWCCCKLMVCSGTGMYVVRYARPGLRRASPNLISIYLAQGKHWFEQETFIKRCVRRLGSLILPYNTLNQIKSSHYDPPFHFKKIVKSHSFLIGLSCCNLPRECRHLAVSWKSDYFKRRTKRRQKE